MNKLDLIPFSKERNFKPNWFCSYQMSLMTIMLKLMLCEIMVRVHFIVVTILNKFYKIQFFFWITASWEGHLKCVEFLVSKGADKDQRLNSECWTPLMLGIYIMKFLNIQLHFILASFRGHIEIVKLLIKHGANVNYEITGGYYDCFTTLMLSYFFYY